MPVKGMAPTQFIKPKEVVISWDSWRKGLNLLLRENEIEGSEVVAATNLLLIGSGVPTKRWGSRDFFLAGATGSGRFILPIKDSSDDIQVLALTDEGFVTKKSGASYIRLTGASWPSGTTLEGAQLGGNAYLVSPDREMVRYDFEDLISFATIERPTMTLATNVSTATNITGGNIVSWRVTAIGKSGGESLAAPPISVTSLPQDLTKALIYVKWAPVSAASGDLQGYNVYRGPAGDERWVGGVGASSVEFFDFGTPTPDPFRIVPVADETGGLKAKYILRFQDRLIVAGIPGEPTKVYISGRYPEQERFDWYAGGGYVHIEPDSGQNVTGLGIHQEKLVIFKENSVWQVTLDQVQFGQYIVLDPKYKLLTASQGCSSHRSIVPVENDLMFSNRKGMYILRYEPQLLTVLNANEISAKIKPFFEGLSDADLTSCAGAYIDKKYVLSFPNSKKTIVFDRERLSFTGPWTTPFGISQWTRYVDSEGQERWVGIDSNDNYVTEFSKQFTDDKGTAIRTIFKSKKEDFGDWTIFKTLNEVFTNFRSAAGTIAVNIYIEDRTGSTINARSFTISAAGASGTSGIGTDTIGTFLLGLSNNLPQESTSELPRKVFIYKTARTFQVEVRTTGRTANYELLGVKAVAIAQSRGNSPSSWNAS